MSKLHDKIGVIQWKRPDQKEGRDRVRRLLEEELAELQAKIADDKRRSKLNIAQDRTGHRPTARKHRPVHPSATKPVPNIERRILHGFETR